MAKSSKPVVKKAARTKPASKNITKLSSKKATRTSVKKDGSIIKYADKSKGQPKELTDIFEAIKAILSPYEKGAMKAHAATGGQFTLISHTPVDIAGRKKHEMWFASALLHKGYVGFDFIPV